MAGTTTRRSRTATTWITCTRAGCTITTATTATTTARSRSSSSRPSRSGHGHSGAERRAAHAPRRASRPAPAMSTLAWIVLSGILMSAIALVGSVTLLLRPERLERLLRPLVAFAAGTLLGGALLHMLPAAIEETGPRPGVFLAVLVGFALFFAIEQFLHWHHS